MTKFSAHLGYLFSELPLRERFFAAKDNGFDAVEHPAPYSAPATEVAGWLNETGLTFVQMGLPAGDPARGEKGMAALPDRRGGFRASIDVGLDYAQAIGCKAVHAMSGVRPAEVPHAELWDTYLENLAVASDAAAKRDMLLLLEPIGQATIADYYMNDPELALQAIAALNRPNVRIIFDVFHTVNAGLDPIAFIRAHAELIHHIHIADHPGRHEPGTGRIDFRAVYAALDKAGFDGFIGCEYIPAAGTAEGLSWLPEHRT